MQEKPDLARRQQTRNVLSGVVGFFMFIGLAVFAWTVGDPSDQEIRPSVEARATSPDEPDPGEERMVAQQDVVPDPPAGAAASSGTDEGAVTQEEGTASRQIEEAREVLANDAAVTTLVLGDATGDDTRKWVHLWARSLAEERPVSIAHWDAVPDPGYYPAVALSTEGGGSPLMVWNGSVAGATAKTAQAGLSAFVPEAPDVVLLNFGQTTALEDLPGQMDALVDDIRGQFGDIPVLMVVQNPQDVEADLQVREPAREWAEQADVGLLDVAAHFPALDNDLPIDATSTSVRGQQLWAQVVTDALD